MLKRRSHPEIRLLRQFLLKWGTEGSGDSEFLSQQDVAVDGVGNVYVSDILNHRNQKFDSSGNFLLKGGTEGSPGGPQVGWHERGAIWL